MPVIGKAVHHRAKHGQAIPHDPLHTLFLVPGAGPHPGLPGNYLHGAVFHVGDEATGSWVIHVHDADDGASLYSHAEASGRAGKTAGSPRQRAVPPERAGSAGLQAGLNPKPETWGLPAAGQPDQAAKSALPFSPVGGAPEFCRGGRDVFARRLLGHHARAG
jgi:hypothetical protein